MVGMYHALLCDILLAPSDSRCFLWVHVSIAAPAFQWPYYTFYPQIRNDLIGWLPTTPRGNKYVVTLVHYSSKWHFSKTSLLQGFLSLFMSCFTGKVYLRLVVSSSVNTEFHPFSQVWQLRDCDLWPGPWACQLTSATALPRDRALYNIYLPSTEQGLDRTV